MFTRQHYKTIAEIVINEVQSKTDNAGSDICFLCMLGVYADLAAKLTSYFEAENTGFDRDKFLDACGL